MGYEPDAGRDNYSERCNRSANEVGPIEARGSLGRCENFFVSLLGSPFVGLNLLVQFCHGGCCKFHEFSERFNGSGFRSEKLCAGRFYRCLLIKFFRHQLKLSECSLLCGVKFFIAQNVHQPFSAIISYAERKNKAERKEIETSSLRREEAWRTKRFK